MTISELKLYEINNEFQRAIDEMLASEDHNTTMLDEIKEQFESKCINVARYIKSLEAEYEARKEAANAMAARAKSTLAHVEWLTEYLRSNLETSGLAEPIKTIEFDIKLVNNPPSVVIFDSSLVPDVYKNTEVVIKIDKDAIKRDIKEGFEVDGCKLQSKSRLVLK